MTRCRVATDVTPASCTDTAVLVAGTWRLTTSTLTLVKSGGSATASTSKPAGTLLTDRIFAPGVKRWSIQYSAQYGRYGLPSTAPASGEPGSVTSPKVGDCTYAYWW